MIESGTEQSDDWARDQNQDGRNRHCGTNNPGKQCFRQFREFVPIASDSSQCWNKSWRERPKEAEGLERKAELDTEKVAVST